MRVACPTSASPRQRGLSLKPGLSSQPIGLAARAVSSNPSNQRGTSASASRSACAVKGGGQGMKARVAKGTGRTCAGLARRGSNIFQSVATTDVESASRRAVAKNGSRWYNMPLRTLLCPQAPPPRPTHTSIAPVWGAPPHLAALPPPCPACAPVRDRKVPRHPRHPRRLC